MKSIFLVIIFSFLFTQLAIGQINNSISKPDTIRTFFPKSYGIKKWKPVIGFDATRSFYSGAPVKINGLRFGAEYLGVHRFGFGFYGLNKDVVFSDIPVDYATAKPGALVRFKVNYAAVFYERVFFKSKRWEISVPAYLGGGGVEGFVQDSLGFYQKYMANSFSSLSTGTAVKFFIWPWLAPRVSIGHRFMFNTEKSIRKAFNAPYFSFGVALVVGEIYRAVRKKEKEKSKR